MAAELRIDTDLANRAAMAGAFSRTSVPRDLHRRRMWADSRTWSRWIATARCNHCWRTGMSHEEEKDRVAEKALHFASA